jgi:hypothetical protein
MRTAAFLAYGRSYHQALRQQGGKLLPYSSRGNAQGHFDFFDAQRSMMLQQLENLPGW